MVNLIPSAAKKNVIIEYWLRVLTVWAWILTGVALLFILTILPVYVAVDTQIDAHKESAALVSEKITSFESVSNELSLATEQAKLLIANTDKLSVFEFIELFDSLEFDGIEYSQVTVETAVGGGLAPVTLIGSARDRQALADFRDRLLAEEVVETVDFPISNLAKERDINFAITVNMTSQL